MGKGEAGGGIAKIARYVLDHTIFVVRTKYFANQQTIWYDIEAIPWKRHEANTYKWGLSMTRFFKVYRIILWVAILALILPLIVAGFYNRPTADDLYFLKGIRNAAPHIHSILDVFQDAAKRAYDQWSTITGTFSIFFIYSLLWHAFKETLPYFSLLFIMFGLVYACFQAARCARCMCKDLPRAAADCLALLLGCMLVLMMPNAYEGFFWISGAVYTIAYAATFCAFCSIFRKCLLQQKKAAVSDAFYLPLMCVAFFLIGGGDYLNSTSALVLYGFLSIWVLASGKPKRYLLPFVFLLAGYILCIMAPGNSVRQNVIGAQTPVPLALVTSFLHAFRFVFSNLRWWVFLALCLPAVVEVAKHASCSFKQLIVVLFASFALLASCFFPNIFTRYTVEARHTNRFFMMLCPLLLLNATVFASYVLTALRRGNGFEGTAARLPLPAPQVATLLSIVFIVFMMLSTNLTFSPFRFNCSIPSVKAVSYFRDGQLQTYAQEYDDIVTLLKENPGQLVVAPCPHNALLGTPDLCGDPLSWKNADFAEYYGSTGSQVSCY